MSFRVLALAGVDAGTLPAVSGFVSAAGALLVGPIRVELGAGFWPARAGSTAARPAAGGEVDLVAGTAGACYSFALGRVELGPCLAAEIGRLHAAGFGVSSPGEGAALWSAVKAGGLIAWAPIDRIGLLLRLDAAIPLSRPAFVLENVGLVYRPGPVAGRAAAGIEVRF
jgi:hypothetical protein